MPQSLHEADKQCTRPAHAAPPATPAPASPYELYNFRANHEPCANQGPERLRVVSRGLAHPPPCRHVGTCDHMSSPSAGGVLEGSLSALVACRAGRAATHCGGRAPGRGEHWHRTCAMSVQPQCSPAGGIAGHAIRVQQRLGATGLRHALAPVGRSLALTAVVVREGVRGRPDQQYRIGRERDTVRQGGRVEHQAALVGRARRRNAGHLQPPQLD